MVHPNVFKKGRIPKKLSGFAFGLVLNVCNAKIWYA